MTNPDFSPGLAAKRRRCLRMQSARREDGVGIPDGMWRRPGERNAADAGKFGVAAEGWREIRVNPPGRRDGL